MLLSDLYGTESLSGGKEVMDTNRTTRSLPASISAGLRYHGSMTGRLYETHPQT